MRILFSSTAIIFVLVLSQFAWSQTAVTIDVSCRQNQQDRFDEGWRFTSESRKFANSCADGRTTRSMEILSENDQEIQFANFFHNDKFWTARLKKNDLAQAKFVIVYFSVNIPVLNNLLKSAHTEVHFSLKEGLHLVSQTSAEETVVKELSVSWEANAPVGISYDFLVGTKKNYSIVGRLVSFNTRVKELTVPTGELRKTLSYDMKLTPQEATRFLEKSIRASQEAGMQEFYSTLSNNCTTKQFDLLDSILTETRANYRPKPFVTAVWLDPVAGPSRNALLKRGLVSPGQKPVEVAKALGMRSVK